MITIGLTGGIGSGKSTVAQMLVDKGAAFVNADLIGHRSYVKGTAIYEQLVAEFGGEIIGADGEVDRQRLGEHVFRDPSARERLNAIVWPAMAELMAQDLEAARSRGARLAVLEAAVLLEAGWTWLVDEVWVVIASAEVAVRRLEAKGMTRQAAEARIRSQLSNEERAYQSDVVVKNDGTLAELEAQVQSLWDGLQERMAQQAHR
ncbi:MAG: dephospho-CoA kinase [Dehalococcoidia bacterium]|jgi:dephospho-CoA kinase